MHAYTNQTGITCITNLLSASPSQKATRLEDITFKSDTWGANFPAKSNLQTLIRVVLSADITLQYEQMICNMRPTH